MKNIGYSFQYNGGVTPESEEPEDEEEAVENTHNERKAKIKELRELFKSGGIKLPQYQALSNMISKKKIRWKKNLLVEEESAEYSSGESIV